jgi:ACS family hexuronate transporter-like MFS transporter
MVPRRERALAIGIFNAGSNVGAIVTPLLVPIIAVTLGWRWAFILTGLLTVVWLAAWLAIYRRPRDKAGLSPRNSPGSRPSLPNPSAPSPGSACSAIARHGPI